RGGALGELRIGAPLTVEPFAPLPEAPLGASAVSRALRAGDETEGPRVSAGGELPEDAAREAQLLLDDEVHDVVGQHLVVARRRAHLEGREPRGSHSNPIAARPGACDRDEHVPSPPMSAAPPGGRHQREQPPRSRPQDSSGAGHVDRRLTHITPRTTIDRKSTRLNSSHVKISYAVFCLK